ncbi:hypothetical protein OG21DRAFT_1527777 [Imleria badia]|nr:hypothetical protein OG21DRAFT_1527777 [Imleria badia]
MSMIKHLRRHHHLPRPNQMRALRLNPTTRGTVSCFVGRGLLTRFTSSHGSKKVTAQPNTAGDADKVDKAKKAKKKKEQKLEDLEDTGRRECISVARYIPRGLDTFSGLTDIIKVCVLLEQEEKPKPNEDENVKASRKQYLGRLHVPIIFATYMHSESIDSDERTKDRYQRTFNHLMVHTPYLKSLLHANGKPSAKGHSLVKEMKTVIMHIRSKDGCHLHKLVGTYAAPDPNNQVVQPPVSADTKAGHSQMGFAHPELGALLCPVKYLQEFKADPHA